MAGPYNYKIALSFVKSMQVERGPSLIVKGAKTLLLVKTQSD